MFADRPACFSKLTTCIISHQQGFKNEFFFGVVLVIDLVIYPQWCVINEYKSFTGAQCCTVEYNTGE